MCPAQCTISLDSPSQATISFAMTEPSRDNTILAEARKELEKIVWYEKDGVYYYGSPYVPDFEEMFRQISTAPLQPGDVLVTGFMRSGNHWAWEIIHMILNDTLDYTDRDWAQYHLDVKGNNVHAHLASLGYPRAMGTHLQPGRLPDDVTKVPVKIIYTLRNPKDVLASWYKLSTSLSNEDRFYGSWDHFFELQVRPTVILLVRNPQQSGALAYHQMSLYYSTSNPSVGSFL